MLHLHEVNKIKIDDFGFEITFWVKMFLAPHPYGVYMYFLVCQDIYDIKYRRPIHFTYAAAIFNPHLYL